MSMKENTTTTALLGLGTLLAVTIGLFAVASEPDSTKKTPANVLQYCDQWKGSDFYPKCISQF